MPGIPVVRSRMNSILALALVVMVPPAEAGKAVKPLCGKGALNCVDAPFAGGVTPSGATIWTHLNGATTVRVRYQPITTKKWLQSPTPPNGLNYNVPMSPALKKAFKTPSSSFDPDVYDTK